MIEKKRINWIDVAKAIGIYLIYLGHCNKNAGAAYSFVFKFHVPLFFFLSGCSENFNKEEKVIKNIKKNLVTILFPALIFALLSLILNVLFNNLGLNEVRLCFDEIKRGIIRNTFAAQSLWFFSCLFVVKCLFSIIEKFKNKIILLLFAVFSSLISFYYFNPIADYVPGYYLNYFNFDWAIQYFNYYIIGYILYPYINNIFKTNSKKSFIFKSLMAVLSILFGTSVFFGKNILNFLPTFLAYSLRTYLLITMILVIAHLFENNNKLKEIGKNTLYLCGSEYIVKLLIRCTLGIVGLNITLSNPLNAWIYVGILILIANKYLVPLEKNMFEYIKKYFAKLKDIVIIIKN